MLNYTSLRAVFACCVISTRTPYFVPSCVGLLVHFGGGQSREVLGVPETVILDTGGEAQTVLM